MTQDSEVPTASQVVAAQVRGLRKDQGISAQKLAQRSADAGAAGISRSVIANLESGRRPSVSVDDVLMFAYLLNVAPVHLLVPMTGDTKIAIGNLAAGPAAARAWIRGQGALAGQNAQRYFSQVPGQEWAAEQDGGAQEIHHFALKLIAATGDGDKAEVLNILDDLSYQIDRVRRDMGEPSSTQSQEA